MQAPPPADVRAVLDSVFTDPAYDWGPDRDPINWLLLGWTALTDWLVRFREGNPVLYQWFLFGLIAVLVVIVVHASWTLLVTLRSPPVPRDRAPVPPTARPRNARWYAVRAEEHAASGRFTEAVQDAFHALVLDLDGQGILRYRPAKTPGEYAAEPGLAPADRDRLKHLVGHLYRFVFGGERCTAEDYAAWQSLARGAWHATAS